MGGDYDLRTWKGVADWLVAVVAVSSLVLGVGNAHRVSKAGERERKKTSIECFQRAVSRLGGDADLKSALPSLGDSPWDPARDLRRRCPRALEDLELSLEYDPRNSDAWALLGICELSALDRVRGEQHLSRALQNDPAHLIALQAMVEIRRSAGNLKGAREILQQANEAKPDDPGVLRVYGGFLISSRLYEEAVSLLKEAVEVDSGDPELHRMLWVALEKSGEAEAALEQLALAVEAGHPNPHFLLVYGARLAQNEDYLDAERVYRDAIRRDPTSIYPYLDLGYLLSRTNRVDEAISTYVGGLRRSVRPHLHPSTHTQKALARGNRRSRETLEGFIEFSEALRATYQGEERYWLMKADALFDARQIEEAVMEYCEISRVHTTSFESVWRCGTGSALIGRWANAADALGKAIALRPRETEPRAVLGQVLLQAGRPNEAREAIERIDWSSLDVEGVQKNYMIALLGVGDHEEVVSTFLSDEYAGHVRDPAIRLVYGVALAELGRQDEALRIFESTRRGLLESSDATRDLLWMMENDVKIDAAGSSSEVAGASR